MDVIFCRDSQTEGREMNPEETAKLSELYVFGNGVKVRRSDLEDRQVERYRKPGNPNLHEPVEEEWLLREFSENTPPRPVFLDIGAAIGYYCIVIKARWPNARVYAVEPLPRHADAITENLQINSIDESGVSILRIAVAPHDGSAFLHDYGYGAYLAASSGSQAKNVQTKKLSMLLRELPPVHLMKMDIQGLELDIFEKDQILTQRLITNVIVGTHSEYIHSRLLTVLRDANYRVVFEDAKPTMQPDGIIVATCS
jgi:FkbM family methyltransferase